MVGDPLTARRPQGRLSACRVWRGMLAFRPALIGAQALARAASRDPDASLGGRDHPSRIITRGRVPRAGGVVLVTHD